MVSVTMIGKRNEETI